MERTCRLSIVNALSIASKYVPYDVPIDVGQLANRLMGSDKQNDAVQQNFASCDDLPLRLPWGQTGGVGLSVTIIIFTTLVAILFLAC